MWFSTNREIFPYSKVTDSVLTENKISCSEMPYENSYKTLCTFLPFLLYQIHKNKNNHHRDEEVNYFVFIHGLILPLFFEIV